MPPLSNRIAVCEGRLDIEHKKANAKEHKIIFKYDLTNFMIYDIITVGMCLNLSDNQLFRKDCLILNEQSI